ncbi:hypothetical protein D3C87_1725340 [compost metagenome]
MPSPLAWWHEAQLAWYKAAPSAAFLGAVVGTPAGASAMGILTLGLVSPSERL